MTLYLLRHAMAVSRPSWEAGDHLRPLSRLGLRQAAALADLLADRPVARISSSPYVRCTETVGPLAERRGIAVEESPALAEGAPLAGVLALVGDLVGCDAVLCSHGDVIPVLLEHYASLGVDLGPEPACTKASTWVITTNGSRIVSACYLRPPPG